MNNTKIGRILNKLLAEQNLRVSELARRVKIPQATVQRISTGTCANPHISSLKPIADYFSITVDQLKGLEPIAKFDMISKVPLLKWSEAVEWIKNCGDSVNREFIIADISISNNSYALKVLDSAMEPFFPRETLLIVDPAIPPKDKSYIIVLCHGATTPIFRQLIVNGPDKILKALSPDTDIYKMIRLSQSDIILATVVQARCNYIN